MIPAESPKRQRTHPKSLDRDIPSQWAMKGASSSPLKPRFKMDHSHALHLPSKSPFSNIGGRSSNCLHNLSTASTTKTSNMGTSFTESFISSDSADSKSSIIHDRMSDFCDYSTGISSPACCDDLGEGVVGLSALSSGINEFARGNKNMQVTDGVIPARPNQGDVDSMILGHEDSFISSISATSSPPSFYRDDHEVEGGVDDLLENVTSSPNSPQSVGIGARVLTPEPRRGTAIRLFQPSPPPSSPSVRQFGSHIPKSPLKSSKKFHSLATLRTPVVAAVLSSSGMEGNESPISFATGTYNNQTRPVIPCDPKGRESQRILMTNSPLRSKRTSDGSPSYDKKCVDNDSILAMKGDPEDVDESILRLEESYSSSYKGYASDEEFHEDLGNGYGSYFLADDGNEERLNCPDQDKTVDSTTSTSLPNSMRELQFVPKHDISHNPTASGTQQSRGIEAKVWCNRADEDELWPSRTSSPSSALSTAASTPSRSRKRGDRDYSLDVEINMAASSKALQCASLPSSLQDSECNRKQQRHSYTDSGHHCNVIRRSGNEITKGPGIFDSPNKKSTSGFVFYGLDSCDESDEIDMNSTGNDSDSSIVQSFPDLLSSSKTSLPPLPTTPFRGQFGTRRPSAPHTISHPSRQNIKGNGSPLIMRKGSLSSYDWRRKRGALTSGVRGAGEDRASRRGLFSDDMDVYSGMTSPDLTSWHTLPSSPASSRSVFSADNEKRGFNSEECEDSSAMSKQGFLDINSSHDMKLVGNTSYCNDLSQPGDRSASDTLNSSGMSAGSASASRPMPDQGAFDHAPCMSHSAPNKFSLFPPSPNEANRRRCHSVDVNAFKAEPQRAFGVKSRVCPPTPERTSLWVHIDQNHPDFYDQSGADSFLAGGDQSRQITQNNSMDDSCYDDEDCDDFNLSRPSFMFSQDRNSLFGEVGLPTAMRRQNSLIDNKILASSAPRSFGDEEKRSGSGVPGTESVLFERDFVNNGIIGSGTFAEVFKCTLKNGSNEAYAIKKSRRQFRSKRDRADLLSEVYIMQVVGKTECPYVIQFYQAWQENSYFYVQIELAERGTLRDLMNSSSYSKQIIQDKTIIRVLHDVASGLEHIHQCGVVHLDIKPQNILISRDGTVKIGDFGIAMAQGTDDDEGHEGDTRYLPHEMLNSADRHYSADIFSLGLTLYEVCLVPDLDVLPYSGELWHDLREGRAPALSSARCEALVIAISTAMAPNPSKRPSAADLLLSSCMKMVDFSVPCDELLVAEMLPPSPRFSRSNSFCPVVSNMPSVGGSLGNCAVEVSSGESSKQCSTPSGAAYRHFVTSPPYAGQVRIVPEDRQQLRTSPSLPHNFLSQTIVSPRAGALDDNRSTCSLSANLQDGFHASQSSPLPLATHYTFKDSPHGSPLTVMGGSSLTNCSSSQSPCHSQSASRQPIPTTAVKSRKNSRTVSS